MKKISLYTEHYDRKFAEAQVYAKKVKVRAVQITVEDLINHQYADKGVHFDNKAREYVIDTYVTRVSNGSRKRELEATRPVSAGEWIVTNPKAQEGDYDNHYVISDRTFRERHEPTEEPGIYQGKGLIRIISNDTGESVEVISHWGKSQQNGDSNCYFCAPYYREDPNDLAKLDRYIISENDFATYGLATEVLGSDWNKPILEKYRVEYVEGPCAFDPYASRYEGKKDVLAFSEKDAARKVCKSSPSIHCSISSVEKIK